MISGSNIRKRRRDLQRASILATVAFCLAGFALERAISASDFRSQSTSDEARIRALLTQITEAWNRADPKGVAAVFTSDGHLIAGDGTHVVTRAAIERYFAQLLEKLPKGTTFTATVTSVQFTGSNTAILISEGGFLMPGETTVAAERQGTQSIVAVRNGGSWHAVLVQRTRKLVAAPSAPK